MKNNKSRTKKDIQLKAKKQQKNIKAGNAKAQKPKKNIKLPAPLQKIVDVVVEPLKKISKRSQGRNHPEVDVPFAESSSATELTTSMKFFYSNDRFIDTFDDEHIYNQLCKHYPALHAENKNLQNKRKAILELLSNIELMDSLKDGYNMSPFDVIRFLFRLCPSLFKGIFVKKVQNTIKKQKYARELKSHKYKIAKSHIKAAYRRRRSF